VPLVHEPVADVDDQSDEDHEHREAERDEHQDAAPFVADPPHGYEHPAPYTVGLASRRMVDEPVIVVWPIPTRDPRKGSQL
jgi:hypothetical protein